MAVFRASETIWFRHKTETLYVFEDNSKRDAQSIMPSYQEALENDAGLQSLDNKLQTYAIGAVLALADGGPSTDFMGKIIVNVRCMNQESSDAVLRQRNAFESMNLISGDEESFNLLVDEYLDNSLQMLNFLSKLDRFLQAARHTHSHIEDVTLECFEKKTAMGTRDYTMISKMLKNLKASEDVSGWDSSAGELLEEVVRLGSQQKKMLEKLKVYNEKLKVQNEKLGKKESGDRSSHKLPMTLFVVAGVGLLISAVVTVVLAIPAVAPALSAALVPLLKGGDWLINWFEKYETVLKDQPEENVAMQADARVSIQELGNLEILIHRVVTKIDSLLLTPNSTIEKQIDFTMKDIEHKLERFLRDIETLQEEADKCSSEILNARHKVEEFLNVRNNIKFANRSQWCTIL